MSLALVAGKEFSCRSFWLMQHLAAAVQKPSCLSGEARDALAAVMHTVFKLRSAAVLRRLEVST